MVCWCRPHDQKYKTMKRGGKKYWRHTWCPAGLSIKGKRQTFFFLNYPSYSFDVEGMTPSAGPNSDISWRKKFHFLNVTAGLNTRVEQASSSSVAEARPSVYPPRVTMGVRPCLHSWIQTSGESLVLTYSGGSFFFSSSHHIRALDAETLSFVSFFFSLFLCLFIRLAHVRTRRPRQRHTNNGSRGLFWTRGTIAISKGE